MNEKIRELFKTIRKYKHTYNLMSNPPQVRYNYTIEEQDIEKFAELIVRECASVVKKEMDYDANWCDDKILKHFGVEE